MIRYETKSKIQVMHKSVVNKDKSYRYMIFSILVALFIYGFLPVKAEASETFKMSLTQAVKTALKNNQDLKISKNNVSYSRLTLKKEKNDYLPQVTGSTSTMVKNEYGESGSDRSSFSTDAEVTAQLNLFNGFEDKASLESAQYELSSYEHSEIRQEQQVIYDTVSAYLDVVKQLREIDIARENLTYNSSQEEEIKAFYQAGKIPVTDFYQQQAETAKARLEYIDAENNYNVSRMELFKTIGISEKEDIILEIQESTLASMTPETDVNALIESAFQIRPDLLALKKNLFSKEALIKEAEAGKYPSLNLNAGIGSQYDDRNDGNFMDQYGNDNLNSYVGLSVSLPIFDKQLTKVKVSQAKIDKQSAQVTIEKLKQQIRVELGQAVADYKTACETIKVSESALIYTNKAFESVYQRYKMGAAGFTELIEIQSDQVEARNNMVEAEIDKMLKTISIYFYKGDLGLSDLLQEKIS